MPKPCLVICTSPISSLVAVTGLCGKQFEHPQLVPAKQGFPTGAFHPKCERVFAEMKLTGEQFVYAVTGE